MLWALGQFNPLLTSQTAKKLFTGEVRQWPNWFGTDRKNDLPHGVFDALYASWCNVGMCRGGERICSLFLKWQLKTLWWQWWETRCYKVMATCTMSNKEKENNFGKLNNKKRLHFKKQILFLLKDPEDCFQAGSTALPLQLLWEEGIWRTGTAIIPVAPLATAACWVLRALWCQNTSSREWLYAVTRPASQGMIYSLLCRPQTYLSFRL